MPGFKLGAGQLKPEEATNTSFGIVYDSGDFSLTGEKQFLGEFLNLDRDLVETTYTGFAILKRYNTRSKSHDMRSIDLISQDSIDNLKLYYPRHQHCII